MTLRCVFILVQLNKFVVVCGSAVPRGNIGNVFLSAYILFKCDCRVSHLFILSWARVRRVALGSVVSE